MRISEMGDNTVLTGLELMVMSCTLRETKTKKHFLSGVVSTDENEEVKFTIWDVDPNKYNMEQGDFIEVLKGKKGSYNDAPQITIENWREASSDPAKFIPTSPIKRDILEAEFIALIAELPSYENRMTSTAANLIANMKKFHIYEPFMQMPAAMKHHHSYIHGLLHHSVSMAKLAKAIAVLYPEIQTDILVLGALVHDIAKVLEYETDKFGLASGTTVIGVLEGHVSLGTDMIQKLLEGEDKTIVRQIRHLIASHHGLKEWGAVKEPATLEASILHQIDMIDASASSYMRLANSSADVKIFSPSLRRDVLISRRI